MPREARVALLCLDPWRLEETSDHRPFNYAVRRIQAAILGHPALRSREVALLESLSLDVDELSARIEAFDPDVIGVSAYVWSFPTLLEACKRAKRVRPDRTVVFGGPSARPEMFELPQHREAAAAVDAIVVGEGEDCIQEILLAPDHQRSTLSGITGLAVHADDRWVFTGDRKLAPPDAHPSPYQMGLMPEGITGQIESSRGCPLSCTYCEWGDTGVTPRTFGREYLVKELEALKRVNAKGTWLVDPGLNLNSRAFRNLRLAEAEVGTLKALGHFRCEIYPSHLTNEHLEFLEATSAHYAGIGLQSFDVDVLRSVERPFNEARFDRVVSEVASIVPDTVVEVIMGLPGDSPEGFKRTVEKVRTLPVGVRVFHCLVLPSALMTRAPTSFDLTYDPFTLQMISCRGWSRADVEQTCRWLDEFAHSEGSEIPHGGTWKFPRPGRSGAESPRAVPEVGRAAHQSGSGPADVASPSRRAIVPDEMRVALQRRIEDVAPWKLHEVEILHGDMSEGLVLLLHTPHEVVSLRVTPARETERAYLVTEGVAYSYEIVHERPTAESLATLDRVIEGLHPVLGVVVLGMKRNRDASHGKRALRIIEAPSRAARASDGDAPPALSNRSEPRRR